MKCPGFVPADFEATLCEHLGRKVAIMGIGNPLRGDDSVGVCLVKALQAVQPSPVLGLFVCETTPENFVGPVTDFEPDIVLMIDAAELGEKPGSVRLIGIENIADCGMTTHSLSLGLLGKMLESVTGANVVLLAVQPKRRDFGTDLSREVLRTLHYLTGAFGRVLQGR
jgi:hydrogenase 3 maturation protease